MTTTEALAQYMASASSAARNYAKSTNVSEIAVEKFATIQRSAEVATMAQSKSLSNVRAIINTYNAGADKLNLTTTEFTQSVKESKHKVQMELESEQSYYDWLEKRSKEVYDAQIIDEGDYWKYQEEVFSGRRNVIKDYLIHLSLLLFAFFSFIIPYLPIKKRSRT